LLIELGDPSGAPPKPPARFAGVNPAPLVIELGGASGAPPKPPARFAGVNPAPLVIELGGASGAPPKPPLASRESIPLRSSLSWGVLAAHPQTPRSLRRRQPRSASSPVPISSPRQ